MDGQTSFDVVRRGYDTDQVDQFLRTQADAWAAELADSRSANEDLQGRITAADAELAAFRAQEQDLQQRLETADQAYDNLTQKAEREIEEKRRAQEEELAQLRIDAASYAAQVRADAESEAATINEQAAKTTSEADQKARAAAESVLREHEGVLNQLQSDFDARFARTKAQYERVLTALQAKVDELTATHEGLVSGLEAIARGGLAATTLDDVETLPGPEMTQTAPDAKVKAEAEAEAANDVSPSVDIDLDSDDHSVGEGPVVDDNHSPDDVAGNGLSVDEPHALNGSVNGAAEDTSPAT